MTGCTFDEAVAALRAGKACVFPTDTVYGVGVAVRFASSPQAIYQAKRRDSNKAIPWLVGSQDHLALYGSNVPAYAQALASAFWPGPLTLVVHASPAVPPAFASADGTIALRMPDCEAALELIAVLDSPLATSSANFQGDPPPQSFADVNPGFLQAVDAAMDDGGLHSGLSSTIVDCTGASPVLVRLGGVSEEQVFQVAASAS